jgi:hypothetical protein
VADVSLMAVPSQQDGTQCPNCGAEVVADQRYCLSCGHPVSSVRLGFLDVLQEEGAHPAPQWAEPTMLQTSAAGYSPPPASSGLGGWIRRNGALFGLLSVLILCLIVGLLVGHWVSQGSKAPATSTVKLEGNFGALAPAAATSSSRAATKHAPSPAAKAAQVKSEAREAAEGAKETKAEKAPPPPPKKVTHHELENLSKSTGKKHVEELNAKGAEPIETGG